MKFTYHVKLERLPNTERFEPESWVELLVMLREFWIPKYGEVEWGIRSTR